METGKANLILPSDEICAKGTKDWPHAPPHRLSTAGVFFLTAKAREGWHLVADDAMKDWFQDRLLKLCQDYAWRIEAWAILSNHYHFIGHSPPAADGAGTTLGPLIQKLHSQTTKELNLRGNKPGRSRLWQNFRETLLTYQPGYLARLHYVHQNAVHHGLGPAGSDWKWCGAGRFKEAVTPAWVKTIASFKYDQIAQQDGE